MHKLTNELFDKVIVRETFNKNNQKLSLCIPTGNSYPPPSFMIFER